MEGLIILVGFPAAFMVLAGIIKLVERKYGEEVMHSTAFCFSSIIIINIITVIGLSYWTA